MTNRLLINSSGLKISKPGFDVLSTGIENLVFSSDYINARVLQTGTVTLSNSQACFYGTTYPFVPFAIFYVNTSGGWRHAAAGGPAQDILNPPKPYIQVFNNRFVGQGYPQSSFTFMYILTER